MFAQKFIDNMSNPVCISPLKFYDSPAKQSHRKSYAHGHISPLITKLYWIPPFQFVIPNQLYADGGNLSVVKLYNAKTDEEVTDLSWVFTHNSNFGVRNIDGYKIGLFIPKKEFADDIKNFNQNTQKQVTVRESGSLDIDVANSITVSASGTNRYKFLNVEAGDVITIKATFGQASYWSSYIRYGVIQSRQAGVNVSQAAGISGKAEIETAIKIETSGIFIVCYYSNANFISINVEAYNSISIPEGLYYLKLASGNGGLWTYYSEVFCFTNVTKDCLELEYWNETGNFAIKNGVIAFPYDFHFKLLLKTEIGKPEYNFEEESTKRLGYTFVESQVSKKTYKFNAIVPEYICDALRLVRLCDNKIIRCKDDEYEAITFEMEAEWQTQGDLASVTCEFETDNVIANIAGFVPDKLGGDYNNDYDDDFDKE